jgi:hypothetical protein
VYAQIMANNSSYPSLQISSQCWRVSCGLTLNGRLQTAVLLLLLLLLLCCCYAYIALLLPLSKTPHLLALINVVDPFLPYAFP